MNVPRGAADLSLPVLSDRKHVRRSRSGRRRAIVLGLIQLIMIAHIVQWAVGGRTISPVEPSEGMEAVTSGVINAGAIFFAVALLATLVLGRWFCGWGCHIVMLQDLCLWLLRKMRLRPSPFRSRVLVYAPFILAVYMFLWPAVHRWGLVPISARLHDWIPAIPAIGPAPAWQGFTLALTTTDFWHTFPGVLVAIPFLLVCGFAAVYFLGAKGFCTYGCPYGGFFAPIEQYAPGRIRVTDACEGCGHCTSVCTSNVRVHEEVREYGMVVDPGCMKCLDCVSVCPKDALYFGFGRPAAAKGKPKHRAPKRVYDLAVGEEIAFAILFLVTFLAARGLYRIIPMLMAAGIAACVTWLAWKLWRLARSESVSLHRFRLKLGGRVTRAGWTYAIIAGFMLLVVAHSGTVRATQFLAERADGKVTVPRELVFSEDTTALPETMAAAARRALRLYDFVEPIGAGGIGFAAHPVNGVRRAWLATCLGQPAMAESLMRQHVARFGRSDGVCRDIFILLRLQRHGDEAQSFARDVLAEEPRFIQLLDQVLLVLVSEEHFAEAIRLAREALASPALDDDERLFVMRRLSLLLLDAGSLDEAIEIIEQTIAIDPSNAFSRAHLARGLAATGRSDDALRHLEAAIEISPDEPLLHDEIAQLLDALGRREESGVHRGEAERLRE